MTATILPLTDAAAAMIIDIAEETSELERHFHNRAFWYGRSGAGFADNTTTAPWTLTAGAPANTFGVAVQISDGTNFAGGSATKSIDIHRILATNGSVAAGAVYKIQFLYGTGLIGTASVLTEISLFTSAGTTRSTPAEMTCIRIGCNNKLWAKVMSSTAGATVDIIFGAHLYPVAPETFVDVGP